MSNVVKFGKKRVALKGVQFPTKHRTQTLTFSFSEISTVSEILSQFSKDDQWVTGSEIAEWLNQSRVSARRWDRPKVSAAINALSCAVKEAGVHSHTVIHGRYGFIISDNRRAINETNVLSARNAQTRMKTSNTFFRRTLGMELDDVQQAVESGIFKLMLVKVDE